MKLRFGLLLLPIFLLSSPVFAATDAKEAASLESAAKDSTQTEKPKASPEEIKYKQDMLKLSRQISQKISQIQAAQKALSGEIYPAYKAEHKAKIRILENQLEALQLQKDQLEVNKSAQDMEKSLGGS